MIPWACPTAKRPRTAGPPMPKHWKRLRDIPAGGGHSAVPCLPEAELYLCGGSAQGHWRGWPHPHHASTRPRPAPGGSPLTIPTCRTSPSAPSWAASSAPTLWQSPAACWWMPTTARSNCASWPMSPAMHTCRRRSSPVPTSTAAPPPRSTTSGLRMSRPACAPAPRPSTLASCTARALTAFPRTSA